MNAHIRKWMPAMCWTWPFTINNVYRARSRECARSNQHPIRQVWWPVLFDMPRKIFAISRSRIVPPALSLHFSFQILATNFLLSSRCWLSWKVSSNVGYKTCICILLCIFFIVQSKKRFLKMYLFCKEISTAC